MHSTDLFFGCVYSVAFTEETEDGDEGNSYSLKIA